MTVDLNANVRVGSLDEMLAHLTGEVLAFGAESSPRGMPTKELLSRSVVLTDPRKRLCGNPARAWNSAYPAAKLCWDVGRMSSMELLEFWNPLAPKFSDNGWSIQGENYGQRIERAQGLPLELLRRDRDSRRSWTPIWLPHDLNISLNSSNVPCCLGYGLRIVDDKLDMQVVFRSQAVVGVMPYDVFLMTAYQELIANELEIELGVTHWTMLSAHVYERELPKAEGIVDWWLERGHKQELEPQVLDFTLSEAEELLPKLEESLRCGEHWEDYPSELEPLTQMMLLYAKQKHADAEKKAS